MVLLGGQKAGIAPSLTHYLSPDFLLITTFFKRGSYLSACGGEIDRIRQATGGPDEPNEPPSLQRLQAMTDVAFVLSQLLHQFKMAHDNATLGALILLEPLSQDVPLQPGKAS
jgi:hypothetical protein